MELTLTHTNADLQTLTPKLERLSVDAPALAALQTWQTHPKNNSPLQPDTAEEDEVNRKDQSPSFVSCAGPTVEDCAVKRVERPDSPQPHAPSDERRVSTIIGGTERMYDLVAISGRSSILVDIHSSLPRSRSGLLESGKIILAHPAIQ